MSYWMFNPCSPCCTTTIAFSGCSPPTGDLSLYVRKILPAAVFKKYTAQNSGQIWQWRVPLGDLWDEKVDSTNIRVYGDRFKTDPKSSGWFRLNHFHIYNGITDPSIFDYIYSMNCNSGESSDLLITFSGGYDVNTSAGSPTRTCGFIGTLKSEYLNNGPCYSGSLRSDNFSIPEKIYLYPTGTAPVGGYNAGTSTVSPYYHQNAATGLPSCNNCWHYPSSPVTNLFFNCQGSGKFQLPGFGLIGSHNGGTIQNEFPSRYGNGFYIEEDTDFFIKDRTTLTSNDSCNIPNDIFLEFHSFSYSGFCGVMPWFFAPATKQGIEIHNIVQLTYNNSIGGWIGSGLPYTMNGNFCCTGNTPRWMDQPFGGEIYTCQNISEPQTFKEIYLFVNHQYLTDTACTKYQSNYTLVFKDDYLRAFVNFSPTGITRSKCNPFVIESYSRKVTAGPKDINDNILINVHPDGNDIFSTHRDYSIGVTYFTDNRRWPVRLDSTVTSTFPGTGDGTNYRDFADSNIKGFFPYYSGYGMTYNRNGETLLNYIDGSNVSHRFGCIMGTGYLRITE